MTTTRNRIPTADEVNALLPAIQTLADTTPYAFAKVRFDADEPRVHIELALPGTNPMTIDAGPAYGTEWKVEASGWSWKTDRADNLRLTAGVLNVAHGLVALLDSLRK